MVINQEYNYIFQGCFIDQSMFPLLLFDNELKIKMLICHCALYFLRGKLFNSDCESETGNEKLTSVA